MSIIDRLFSTTPVTPAPTIPAVPNLSPSGAPVTSVGIDPMASQQVSSTQPSVPAQPLDQFATLWENDPNSTNTQPTPLSFNISPEQLQQLAAKLDFSSVVPQELQTRIAQGGEDAVTASMEMQNIIARAVYQQNALATTKLVEAAYKKAQEGLDAQIEQKFKLMGMAENTTTMNPALSNPAAKPLVEFAQQQILQKFPNASGKELAEQTNKYFNQLASIFNPEMATKANAPSGPTGIGGLPQQAETDWSTYFRT